MASGSSTKKPVLTFGAIADVQYADVEDGFNFNRTKKRYYRYALIQLRKAVKAWNKATEHGTTVEFILQLGDLIDGLCKRGNASERGLHEALDAFSCFSGSVYHVWGNHELYNFSHDYLMRSGLFSGNEKQCSSVQGQAYYSIQPHFALRILALDCYEISLLGRNKDSKEYKEAQVVLEKNPNVDLNSPIGLVGLDRRLVKFNGGVSDTQLKWFENNLQEAKDQKQNVIVFAHCPVYEGSTDEICLCWNHQAVLDVLAQFSDCVLCYLAGHDHDGGHALDESGILHVTFPGVIENCKTNDFATIYLYEDYLHIVGEGRVYTTAVPLKFPIV